MSTQPPSAADGSPPGHVLAADRLVRAAGVFYGLLLVAALAWRTGWAQEPLLYADAEAAARGVAWPADLGWGLAGGAAVIGVSWLATSHSRWGDRLARALAQLVGRPSLGQVAILALASGVGEEAFFRGALQPRVGLLGASLFFALAHFVPRRDMLPWSGFSLVAGLALGALFEWTGNLVAPIAAHALVNGVNLTLLTRRYSDPAEPRKGTKKGDGP